MALNARMSQSDPRLYNPNRDVAHNFEYVVNEVATAIEEGRWKFLSVLAVNHGVTQDDLGLCMAALCKFVVIQADHPGESMPACLARSGYLDLPEAAQAVVMAYLGTVTLGMHWVGVREATLGGNGPALTYKRLRATGRRMTLLMRMPPWRRRLYRLKSRLRRAWRAFTKKDVYDG